MAWWLVACCCSYPLSASIIAGLAIAFHGATGKNVNEVLFSGQDALPGLVEQAGTWSVGALLLLILLKGIAYSLSLGSFRGGPTFPAIFLGAAAGVAASHLPGFALEPAVGVGIGAGTVAVLRLPLSAVVLATLLTVKSGTGDEPLIIVGVVVAYLVTLLLSPKPSGSSAPAASEQTAKPARPAPRPPRPGLPSSGRLRGRQRTAVRRAVQRPQLLGQVGSGRRTRRASPTDPRARRRRRQAGARRHHGDSQPAPQHPRRGSQSEARRSPHDGARVTDPRDQLGPLHQGLRRSRLSQRRSLAHRRAVPCRLRGELYNGACRAW